MRRRYCVPLRPRTLLWFGVLFFVGLISPMLLLLFPVLLLLGAMLVATILLAWLLTGLTWPVQRCRRR